MKVKNAIFYMLALATLMCIPKISPGDQTKGIKVVIKDNSGREIGIYEGSYALLIGASNYIAGWPKLESVPYEIDQVQKALERQGFLVEKIMDPTSDMLTAAFDNFIHKYGFDENNRLLFFFSALMATQKSPMATSKYPTPATRYSVPIFSQAESISTNASMRVLMEPSLNAPEISMESVGNPFPFNI
jgi:hypothetical protein